MTMNIYQIRIRGTVDVTELNSMSPQQMTIIRTTQEATEMMICSDQSGLMGLLRHLHSLGFEFLSLSREDATAERK